MIIDEALPMKIHVLVYDSKYAFRDAIPHGEHPVPPENRVPGCAAKRASPALGVMACINIIHGRLGAVVGLLLRNDQVYLMFPSWNLIVDSRREKGVKKGVIYNHGSCNPVDYIPFAGKPASLRFVLRLQLLYCLHLEQLLVYRRLQSSTFKRLIYIKRVVAYYPIVQRSSVRFTSSESRSSVRLTSSEVLRTIPSSNVSAFDLHQARLCVLYHRSTFQRSIYIKRDFAYYPIVQAICLRHTSSVQPILPFNVPIYPSIHLSI
ncbi:uncharacterized protein BO80DRAFT_22617 [Aspergillus ibericus CBS 121593]|uniref:Uncharacterized protein n=1 Tax=Aspergillus ibericus CBS 121593 TaxID=1448316 RepID=A0A395H521_9EURO|nr:hypothetical protein BO80DRAFT_22617 [Aspergillus ibericus CBS 121593]RAL02967.1 hypothetical protein BO80DRAFT_22617 [Aspergillus ibericus CBS 121593]